jgi:hypothetical protein
MLTILEVVSIYYNRTRTMFERMENILYCYDRYCYASIYAYSLLYIYRDTANMHTYSDIHCCIHTHIITAYRK